MENTFKKIEKLCSKTEIKDLFWQKQSLAVYPIRIFWRKTTFKNKKIPVKTVISVSKRRFKKAVDRNKLRRIIREAFRLNKENLYDFLNSEGIQISMIIIYQTNSKIPYIKIEKSLKSALNKLQTNIVVDRE